MGEKSDFLLGEALMGTAFLGGVWTALRFSPESKLVGVFGQIIAEFVSPIMGKAYVLIFELFFLLIFIGVIFATHEIGGKLGLAAFGSMWLSGLLLVSGVGFGAYLLVLGLLLGGVAVHVHTDESIDPPFGQF